MQIVTAAAAPLLTVGVAQAMVVFGAFLVAALPGPLTRAPSTATGHAHLRRECGCARGATARPARHVGEP